ncbi:MAG: type II secretion system F family protein [Lachnospiraceae bacterium]|nr:type II secretion system F family protein [Lachnospiraceae bacterium]
MLERSSEFIFEKVYRKIEKKPDPNVIRKLRFLDPAGDTGALYREFCIRRIRISMVTFLAGIILAVLMKISAVTGSRVPSDGFEREEWSGKKQGIELYAVTDDERLEMDLSIWPLTLSEEELNTYRDRFLEDITDIIGGENTDLMNVNHDLVLRERYDGYPFKFTWRSSDHGLVSAYDGRIREKEQEGDAVLTVTYSYGEYSGEAGISVHVAEPVMTDEEMLALDIRTFLEESEENGRYEKIWNLPDEINGRKIRWEYRSEDNSGLIMGLFTLVTVIIYAASGKDLSSQTEKRRENMKKTYPKILRQISLYVGAGMTTKAAFMRIVSDAVSSGSTDAVYEEMRSACHEMEQGIGEAECYERFGNRTGLGEYIKLAGMLSRNLKRGDQNFRSRLKTEADMAMKERILQARKTGEEAQTKLLVPMIMMLGVVMVMIMIPAFTGMNI